MTFKLIKFLFTIGKFFAVTPATINVEYPTIYHKLWAVLILSALTIVQIVWFIKRNVLYQTFIHIKLVMRVLRHLTKYTFCCYIVLGVNFTKRNQWIKLMKKLEALSEISDDQSTSKLFYFLLTNVLFWMILLYAGYLFHEVFNINIFEIVIIVFFEWYLLFFYNYLICTILKMLLERYRTLNRLFKTAFYKNNDTRSINEFLKKAEFILCTLKDTVDTFNEIFGWPLLLIVFYSNLLFLDYADDFMKNSENFSQVFKLNVMSISVLLAILPFMIVEFWICHSIGDEMKKIVKKSYRLLRVSERKHNLVEFIDYCLLNNFPEFSAAGFFTIQRSTIVSILGTLTTYLVIMVQFEDNRMK